MLIYALPLEDGSSVFVYFVGGIHEGYIGFNSAIEW